MNLAFLLNFHRPAFQDKEKFNHVFNSCYVPLLKLIKNSKNLKLSLSISLSVLEYLDEIKNAFWIDTIKELVEAEKVELVNCSSYNVSLTNLPTNIAEKQILLNEYALGYYFGRRNGFEGDPSVLVKDIYGFLPYRFWINPSLIHILNDLGYKWVIADFGELTSNVISFKDSAIKIVLKNTLLSNLIASKKDSEITDIANAFFPYLTKPNSNIVVALDAELFGFGIQDGIFFLESLLDYLYSQDVTFMTVSELSTCIDPLEFASVSDFKFESIVPSDNVDSSHLNLFNILIKDYAVVAAKIAQFKQVGGYENLPLWRFDMLEKINDKELEKLIHYDISAARALCADQFNTNTFEEFQSALNLYKECISDMATPNKTESEDLIAALLAKRKAGN